MNLAITAAALLTPLEIVHNPVLLVEDGVIAAVGGRKGVSIPPGSRTVDFPNATLAPGFIDIHIHGAAGFDVMQAATDSSALPAVEALLARHGVTGYCPTSVTAPLDKTLAALDKLGDAVLAQSFRSGAVRARPLGVHLEGPFISTAKCGVHPVHEIREPSIELFQKFHAAAKGAISLMTLAPELPGADVLIREACRRGVRVSLGHSNADLAATRAAIAAGASHATHTFNAMRALDHREPGILGVILSDERVTADIIADGVHVAPEVVKLFLSAKGHDLAVLITDAISATGMGDGRYRLGDSEVDVKGTTCLAGGRLAGSVLTMDRAIRNVMKVAAWSLPESVRLATLNPAKVLGIDNRKGSLAPGKDADIVVLNSQGEVLKTIVGGQL